MFRRKTTITRPDRDRLVEVTRSKANALRGRCSSTNPARDTGRGPCRGTGHVSPNVVTMHSKVQFLDLARERPEVYTLVYPGEASLRAGRLSVLSPMGTGCSVPAREMS